MYAVIKAGGQQFKVQEKDIIEVHRIPGDAGSKVVFDHVLLIGDSKTPKVGTPLVAGASVEAEIVKQKLGPKIVGFNYKPKKNIRKRWGHRSHLTELRVTKINLGKKGGDKDGA